MRICLGLISSGYASPQHQFRCKTSQITAATVPSKNNGSNPIRSQKAHRLWLHRGRTTPRLGSQIVPVTKKNRKIRVFIDFRDLNEAYPKDEFPLPITDVMIDNTCGFEGYPSWMVYWDTIKSRCTLMMKIIHLSECHWGCITILSCPSDKSEIT